MKTPKPQLQRLQTLIDKVARSRAYDPVLDWLKDIEKDDSIVPVDLGTIARD